MTSAGVHVQYEYDVSEALSAWELKERHAKDLPLLVVVCHGFYDNRDEMCFSTGQVLRLQEVRRQQRALVHDDQNKSLSVPLDFSHLFRLAHGRSQPMTLGDILQRHELPVKVKFADSHMRFDSSPDSTTRSLSTLKIIRQHDETYFVANAVMQGQLLETVIPIPMYLKEVRFSVVRGVKGRGLTDGGRGHMHALLHSQALHLDFSQDHGDTGMVQLSEKPIKATDNIYRNIDTTLYINVPEQQQAQRTHTAEQLHRESSQLQQHRALPPLPPLSPSPPLPGSDVTTSGSAVEAGAAEEYENWSTLQRRKVSKGAPDTGDPRPPLGAHSLGDGAAAGDTFYEVHPVEQGDAGVYEPVNAHARHTQSDYTPLTPQAPPGGPPPQTTGSLPRMALELQRALEERKQRVEGASLHNKTADTRTPGTPKVDIPADSSPGKQTPWNVTLRPTPHRAQAQAQPHADAAAGGGPKGHSATLPRTNDKPKTAAAGKPTVKAKPPLVPKPSGDKNVTESSTDPSHPPAQKSACPNTSGASIKQKTKTVPQTVPPDVKHGQTTSAQPTAAATSQPDMYVNLSQMAVVAPVCSAPTPQAPSATLQGGGGRGGGGPGQSTAPRVEEGKALAPLIKVPPAQPTGPHTTLVKGQPSLPLDKPLDSWTMQDVQRVLARLNLSAKYGDTFIHQQVDGKLLRQLTRDTLKEDFGMTGVESQRLQNFVETGHLPK